MKLNYKQFGQGEPIIILHGLFGMLDNWQSIAKKLANQYTVFILDQRNHGKSPHHPVFNYQIMADDLKLFMEENWIYKAHLIGHSMGGKTAMQFALDNPDMINKMIVVDIAPQKYEGGHQLIFEALFDLNLNQISNRKEAEKSLAKKIPAFGVRQFLLKNLTRKKEGGYAWKMNLDAIYRQYLDVLDNVQGETVAVESLFVKGNNSNYILEESKENIHHYFPSAQIKTIDNAGHWVHAEQPHLLLQEILQFIDT